MKELFSHNPNSALGTVTNETVMAGGEVCTLTRHLDEHHRLASLSVGDVQAHFGYDVENRLATVSNAVFTVVYAYTIDGWDAGYSIALTNGMTLSRIVSRDAYRRQLVTAITNSVNGVALNSLAYDHDLLNRVVARNADTFGYNARSEVTAAFILSNAYSYAYDHIGNHTTSSVESVATTYAANILNQYTAVLCAPAPLREPSHDLDGNLLTNGVWSYEYDAENRLAAAYSNSLCVVSNAYDHMGRRVLKVSHGGTETRRFVYDGWNLVQETIQNQQSTITNHYVWGKDLSGTLQGAGGVGGLLAVSLNGSWYFPFFDANGNIMAYVDESGTVVAEYTYDAFGGTIAPSPPMAGIFAHRFSTKYFDSETGLYYYGYRFYDPDLHRWLNRDPIEEEGGFNLYAFCGNEGVSRWDYLGLTKVEISSAIEKRTNAANPARISDFLIVTVTVVEPPPRNSSLNFIQIKNTGGGDWLLDSVDRTYPYYYDREELEKSTRQDQHGTPIIEFADGPDGAHSDVTTFFYLAVVEVKRECIRPRRYPVTQTPVLVGNLISIGFPYWRISFGHSTCTEPQRLSPERNQHAPIAWFQLYKKLLRTRPLPSHGFCHLPFTLSNRRGLCTWIHSKHQFYLSRLLSFASVAACRSPTMWRWWPLCLQLPIPCLQDSRTIHITKQRSATTWNSKVFR